MDIIIVLLCLVLSVRFFKSTLKISRGEFLNIFYTGYYVAQLGIALILILIEPTFSIGDYVTYRVRDLLVMFSVSISARSLAPRPPTPTPRMLSLSLGDLCP